MFTDGFIAKATADHSSLSNPLNYYFYTGKTEQFWTNIQNAVDLGRKETYLFSEEEQEIYRAFTTGKDNEFVEELNGEGVQYRVQSAFITFIGQMSEADIESQDSYWETAIANYQPPAEEGGLAWWAWLLIGLGIAAVVAAATVTTVVLVLRGKKKEEGGHVEKMTVDTTDDKSIDVYGTAEEESNEEEKTEELPEETAQEPALEESAEEAPEELPEEVPEEPTQEPASETEETPAEPAPTDGGQAE